MITARESAVDVRLYFIERDSNQWSECRWGPDSTVPNFWKYSTVSQN